MLSVGATCFNSVLTNLLYDKNNAVIINKNYTE
jgi:hypothetical protein